MSTKIYNAFKVVNVKKPITLNKLSEINESLKEKAFTLYRQELVKIIGRRVWCIKDLYTYFGEDVTTKITDEKMLRRINQIKEGKNLEEIARCDIFDFTSEMKEHETKFGDGFGKFKILYIPDKSNVYGMYFGDHTYSGIIWDDEHFEDYHYQNQTDMPDGMTKQRWKTREKTWDRIIGPDYIPVNHGFEVQILDYYDSLTEMKILKDETFAADAVESGKNDMESRIRNVRERITCPLFPKDADIHTIMEIERSDEYKKWREEIEKDIKEKLEA